MIKISVPYVGGYGYVWMRGLFAILGLLPYIIYKYIRKSYSREAIFGGLYAGIAYMLGLWLQGIGTALTTASNSAFITGLNVLFVHIYVAVFEKKYTKYLFTSIVLSIPGLYIMTDPTAGINIGDLLVLVGSVMWAAQVIIVSKYSHNDPLEFTFYEITPSLLMFIPWFLSNEPLPKPEILLILLYLGIICSNAAFTLQVHGQRWVSPATAATVFLLEPPFASIFAFLILGETMNPQQLIGGALILVGLFMAIRNEIYVKTPTTNI